MTLLELKQHIESFPAGTIFNYGLSNPFSWRGSYDEVAFSVKEEMSTKEQILEKITKAFTGEFIGWKGGEFRYHGGTDIHFEDDCGTWTDGGYTENWISKILRADQVTDSEHRLISLLFKS
jgi:hypothetical protein